MPSVGSAIACALTVFEGHKFKRQVPVGPYIVDFACLGRKLVIEVDGGQHADNARDVRRDAYLRREGFRVLRFWNNDILQDTRGVLEVILDALQPPLSRLSRCAPSAPSPRF